ncbi:putative flippase GtrA [Psychromicrobium silvestre]|uniref:Putative flippase GtrA n=1 Tax=Psychromicrobium silvestre TaxID=1645614 RepID=A0A7Y9S8K8_9MICC|nr:GtrA family protein [Psychromicrobium silvestre]NYE96545.1 putative flippase GtrA [Psychromicrobium silvestre]
MIQTVFQRVQGLVALLWREVAKFGVVGGLGWVIDNGLFTLLWHGPMSDSTLKARVISSSVAILFSWFANRYWTFRHRRGDKPWREFFLFIVMSLIGMGIAVGCQYISRYVLGFETYAADFISGGVIGLILGTIFRFLTYRFFVFTEELDAEPEFAHDHELVEAKDGHREAVRD